MLNYYILKTKGGDDILAVVYTKQLNKNQYLTKEEFEEAQHAEFEKTFKAFKKEVLKEGILKTCQDKMYYVSRTEKEKAKKKAGRRKQLKQMYKERRLAELYDY